MTNEQILRETLEQYVSWLDSVITGNIKPGSGAAIDHWLVPSTGIVSQFNVGKTVLRITAPEPSA